MKCNDNCKYKDGFYCKYLKEDINYKIEIECDCYKEDDKD